MGLTWQAAENPLGQSPLRLCFPPKESGRFTSCIDYRSLRRLDSLRVQGWVLGYVNEGVLH